MRTLVLRRQPYGSKKNTVPFRLEDRLLNIVRYQNPTSVAILNRRGDVAVCGCHGQIGYVNVPPRVASNSSKPANLLEIKHNKAKKCGKGRDMYFDIRRWISARVERERGKETCP